jgi:hypothetical protein
MNPLEALWHFQFVLFACCRDVNVMFQPDGAGEPVVAVDWLRRFILGILQGARTQGDIGSLNVVNQTRNEMHAQAWQLATQYVQSGGRLLKLQAAYGDIDQASAACLLRSLLLADRLLPLFYHHYDCSPDTLVDIIRRANEALRLTALPPHVDVIDPRRYGRAGIDCVSATLINLLDCTLDLSTGHDPGPRPLWWSAEIEESLEDIATRPYNDDEAWLNHAVANGLSNRLRVCLDRTPVDLSQELLDRVRTRAATSDG